MTKALLAITFFFVLEFFMGQQGCSKETSVLFPIMIGDTVCVFDITTLELQPVFIDSTDSVIKSSLKISPSGKYIAIQGYWHEYYSTNCEEEAGESNGLFLVIDIETGNTFSLCNVMVNTWSPVEDRLVYIEGYTWANKGDDWIDESYVGKTVRDFDAITVESTELAISLDMPYDVSWSEYDSQIYILDNNGVRKCDPVTGGQAKTDYMYVNISPDGLYCFLETVDGDPAQLFRNKDNSPVALTCSAGNPIDAESFWPYFLGWGFVDGKSVAYIDFEGLYNIDCKTGRLHEVKPPSPSIDPIDDLVGFRDGRPVWAKVSGDKVELFYY